MTKNEKKWRTTGWVLLLASIAVFAYFAYTDLLILNILTVLIGGTATFMAFSNSMHDCETADCIVCKSERVPFDDIHFAKEEMPDNAAVSHTETEKVDYYPAGEVRPIPDRHDILYFLRKGIKGIEYHDENPANSHVNIRE